MGYNKRIKKKHLFEKEPLYLLKYLEMLKEEKHWHNSGQYYMARECRKRALCLEKENIGGYESYQKTESLYCPTKKSNLHTYDVGLNEKIKEETQRREMTANRMNRGNRSNNDYRSNQGVSRSDSRNWRA
jgi:hypothetical protein